MKQGDCIASIAHRFGFAKDSIWLASENRELRSTRHEYILNPGDTVFVPEKKVSSVGASTGERHQFRRRSVPETLNIRFLKYDEPRSNEPYRLKIDGISRSGKLDSDGHLVASISPDVCDVRIEIGDVDVAVYEFRLGHVDPVNEPTGAQARLYNLGFYDGVIDGDIGPETTAAIKLFQTRFDLECDGQLSPETLDRLEVEHCATQ